MSAQALHDRLGHLDAAGDAQRFHPAGEVDGVAPDVVDELARPMTPATTGPQAMPMRKRTPRRVAASMRADLLDQVERHARPPAPRGRRLGPVMPPTTM